MKINARLIAPVIYQFSWIITLPVLISTSGILSLGVIPLALFWHWISFSLTGHMIISHGCKSRWLPDSVMKLLFFINSYIPVSLWASYHIQHHKHHDTPSDPQSRDYHGKTPLLAYYDPAKIDVRTFVKSERDPVNRVFTKYYFLLLSLPFWGLALSDVTTILLLWLVPGSLALNIVLFSAWYSHVNFKPVTDLPFWLNILFLGESQYHDRHHRDWNHCEPMTAWMLRS